jgi:hypothetical protein
MRGRFPLRSRSLNGRSCPTSALLACSLNTRAAHSAHCARDTEHPVIDRVPLPPPTPGGPAPEGPRFQKDHAPIRDPIGLITHPMHFSHELSDDNTGTSQGLFVGSLPAAQLLFRIWTSAPKAESSASFKLKRYRVIALVHSLQQWLEETKDDRE